MPHWWYKKAALHYHTDRKFVHKLLKLKRMRIRRHHSTWIYRRVTKDKSITIITDLGDGNHLVNRITGMKSKEIDYRQLSNTGSASICLNNLPLCVQKWSVKTQNSHDHLNLHTWPVIIHTNFLKPRSVDIMSSHVSSINPVQII